LSFFAITLLAFDDCWLFDAMPRMRRRATCASVHAAFALYDAPAWLAEGPLRFLLWISLTRQVMNKKQ